MPVILDHFFTTQSFQVVMPPWPIFRKHPLPFPAAKTELKKPAAVAKGKSKKKN